MPIASTGASVSPFGFAGGWGYQEDQDSGLKLLGHRYYDPSTGRFLTRDPAKDGRNWYVYCSNNPLSSVDPTGFDNYLIVIGNGNPETQVRYPMEFLLLAMMWKLFLEKRGHHVRVRLGPKPDKLWHDLLWADSFIFIGHGTSAGYLAVRWRGGTAEGDNWDMTPDQFKALLLGKKLGIFLSFACETFASRKSAKVWESCADKCYGFTYIGPHPTDMLDNWGIWEGGDFFHGFPRLNGTGDFLEPGIFDPIHTVPMKTPMH